MQQVMNKIGTNVINWSYVESVTFRSSNALNNDLLVITFTSGKEIKISDPETVVNVMDLFSVFPDVNNDDDRQAMKIATVQTSGVKMKRTSVKAENKSNSPKPMLKTDIPQRR